MYGGPRLAALLALCSLLSSASCADGTPGRDASAEDAGVSIRLTDASAARLDALMSELVDGQYVDTGWSSVSALLRIDHLTGGLLYDRAVGVARADSDNPMTVDRQYLISSATKMMVAVVILQLWEEGRLGESGLDAPLRELGILSREVLDAMSVFEGASYGGDITLRQLLTHTSGLGASWRGVWDDNGQSLPEAMMRHFRCLEDRDCDVSTLPTAKQWRPWVRDDPFAENIALFNSFLAAERESSSARAKPGVEYHYTDVNFWVLGVVIEEIHRQPLHAVMRERIFDPLAMHDTFQSYSADPAEESRNRGLADFYIGPLAAVSGQVNFSPDWAGGGVATTLEDFSKFHLALVRGDLFENAGTYEEMRAPYWEPLDAGAYVEHAGLGYFLTEIGGSGYYGHTGFLGAFSFYDAERQLLFTGTLNKVADNSFFRIVDDIGQAVSVTSAAKP